jgi:hypothetical protein
MSSRWASATAGRTAPGIAVGFDDTLTNPVSVIGVV